MTTTRARLLLLTAIIGLTLPHASQAARCTEQDWNKALISQQILDQHYNLLASQYNHWLPNFKHAIFLHQEFSRAELQFLWRHNKQDFQAAVTQQLGSVKRAIQEIQQLQHQLDDMPTGVAKQWETWFNIGEACKQAGLMSNAFATELYLKSNKELNDQLDLLHQQLAMMRLRYEYELQILTQVMSMP